MTRRTPLRLLSRLFSRLRTGFFGRSPAGAPFWRDWRRLLIAFATVFAAGAFAVLIAVVLLYQRLPDIEALADYRPKQPLRVFTSDGVEIGQFGTERRYLVPIAEIPKRMQDALLAVEDRRFREHGGVDAKGVLRAVLSNVLHMGRRQGGSTITQQVARNFYLSSRKTVERKVSEMMLAFKIERLLTKDQILELYMNQIFLGRRAYGFEAASQAYFGKTMSDLSFAECAMLAGLPQNPVYANPVANPERARKRQLLVLDMMLEAGVIDEAQRAQARAEPLHVRSPLEAGLHAEYVAEMARQTVFAQYGEKTYTEGLKVITSLRSADQQAAYHALRKGLLDHERRQPYRGPEDTEELPAHLGASDPATAQLLAESRDDEDLRVALVSEAGPREVVATLADGEVVHIRGEGLRQATPALSGSRKAIRIQRGSVIRVSQDIGNGKDWAIRQWPEAQGAFIAVDPRNGQVRALVGGFDFSRNQFNHATQASRQPGSSFKPFLYSAALEHGVMPSSVVNDAPLEPLAIAGQEAWDPKNSDGQFDGPLTVRQALARSKNLVTIRLVQLLGTDVAREWAGRFGFAEEQQPDNLTLALGAGATTPLQLAGGYAVLANGGHRVNPVVIERITDARGQTLFEAPPQALGEENRVIPARNAFVTNSLLNEVTRSGTAARAQSSLKRTDLYGKTGTTNDAVDAWFAGFQPSVAAVVWIGYDTPRSLGVRESGGGLSLPVWIDFMRQALKGVPVQAEGAPPEGVERINDEWIYSEWAAGGQRTRIGLEAEQQLAPVLDPQAPQPPAPASSPVFW
jgi:penicillin-binding protein 1A